MIRRLNYTRRQKIKAGDVTIAVRAVSGAAPVASVTAKLDEYNLPADAEVVIEAYRKASYMRHPVGTVSQPPAGSEFTLSEFGSAEGVRFRLKVVGRREDLARRAPVLLAVADRLSPQEGEEDNSDYEKLLKLVPADLEGEIWRLDLQDGPIVEIERTYWDQRSFVRSGWFFPAVMPTILRLTLTEALADSYRDTEDDNWRSMWIRFALTIPGDRDLPGNDDDQIREWVNSRVSAFCRGLKMSERFEAVLKGAE